MKCGCGECIAAGVSDEDMVSVPDWNAPGGSREIHGYELARYIAARKRFQSALAAFNGRKGTHVREPGEEG